VEDYPWAEPRVNKRDNEHAVRGDPPALREAPDEVVRASFAIDVKGSLWATSKLLKASYCLC
jgi:hypothetical protein